MTVVNHDKPAPSDQPTPGDDATGSILARLKAIEERSAAVNQALGVKAEALIKEEGNPLTAALAAEVADRAEAKLVNSALFKGARTAFAIILGVCVLMFGGSVAYFSFQLDSVTDRAEAAMSSIQAQEEQLRSEAGNVDSLAKAVTSHLAALSTAASESASRSTTSIRTSSISATESLSTFTRQGRDSLKAALAAIAATRDTGITLLEDSSSSAIKDLRLSTQRGHDSLAIALDVIAAMRDTALHARLGGRDSMTIQIDVQRTWLPLTGVILGGSGVALALAAIWLTRSRRSRGAA